MDDLFYRPCNVKALLARALALYSSNDCVVGQMRAFGIYEHILSFSKDKHIRNICYRNLLFLMNRGIVQPSNELGSLDILKFPMTMTTCRRFPLFERTVRSFCAHVDRRCIDHLYIIDDGSSESDIAAMRCLLDDFDLSYDIIIKPPEQRGHPQSINLIRAMMIEQSCPFFVHLEDDFEFFLSSVGPSNDCVVGQNPLIRASAEVLFQFPFYGQFLFSNSYKEERADFATLPWGRPRTTESGFVFYEHVWKDPNNPHGYWPGFSLRPGINRVQAWKEMGEVIERGSFEKDYATRWAAAGWKVAYSETSCCEHIGRKTSEKHDPTKDNAYTLNGELQFDNFAWEAVDFDAVRRRVSLSSDAVVGLRGLFLGSKPSRDAAVSAVAHVKLWLELVEKFKQVQALFIWQGEQPADELWREPFYQLNGFDPWDVLLVPNSKTTGLSRSLGEIAEASGQVLLNYTGARKLLNYVEREGFLEPIEVLMRRAKLVIFKARE